MFRFVRCVLAERERKEKKRSESLGISRNFNFENQSVRGIENVESNESRGIKTVFESFFLSLPSFLEIKRFVLVGQFADFLKPIKAARTERMPEDFNIFCGFKVRKSQTICERKKKFFAAIEDP